MRLKRVGQLVVKRFFTMASPVIRVVTYNVLSPTLCEQDWFPKCDPQALKADVRLAGVLSQLEPFVTEESIICLQEIGADWFGAFHTFFDQFNYTFILYNYKSTMGVGLAWPKSKFVAQSIQNCRVGEFIKPRQPVEEELTAVHQALAEVKRGKQQLKAAQEALQAQQDVKAKDPLGLTSLFGGWFGPAQPQSPGNSPQKSASGSGRTSIDASDADVAVHSTTKEEDAELERGFIRPEAEFEQLTKAALRNNRLIFARLKLKQDPSRVICVATYHMPCAFRDPKLMGAHAAASAQVVQRLAKEDPYVFAGDFNFQPDSDCYHLITNGSLAKSSPCYPSLVRNGWKPDLREPMASAIEQAHGSEPDFTNYAENKFGPFIGTLDYIFLSPKLRATGAVLLPSRDAVEDGPYPSLEEPSDHVLVWADVAIKA